MECAGAKAGRQDTYLDLNHEKIGQTWVGPGDTLYRAEAESLDYIVCNYFDCFPNPLKTLFDWYRVLKTGGTVAVVCSNAEEYSDTLGPLANKSKLSSFTAVTLENYFKRAGFHTLIGTKYNSELRLQGVR